jgi:hypothetical protein
MAEITTRRIKDTEELISGIRRQIRALEPRAAAEDPWAAAEMLRLATELQAAATRVIRQLRDTGYTWPDIGFAIGISDVTACKRYMDRGRA